MSDYRIYNTPMVNKDFKGWRADKFLSACFPEISRSQIQRLISDGNVVCDDVTIGDNAYKVKEGESFVLSIPEAVEAEPVPQDIPVDILYQDEDIVVVNKPAGLVVHPGAGVADGTLVNALLYKCHDLSGIGGVRRPGIVHRIDKETSGILVAAKNDNAHKNLCAQFAEHSIERTYFAFVFGVPNPINGTVEGNIGRSPYDRKKMAVIAKGGKPAVTHYQTVENYKTFAAEVRCRLETGRTHQIRVHLTKIGHSLIGDKVYGTGKKITAKGIDDCIKEQVNNFPRQALHAQSLGFIHPRTGERLFFETPLPEDLDGLQAVLRQI